MSEQRGTAQATTTTEDAAGGAAALDFLLSDAALGPLRRLVPVRSGMRLAGSLARQPRLVGLRARELAGELTRIAVGASEVAPHAKDKRFTDPAWRGNPMLRRVMQSYVAWARCAEALVGDAELPAQDAERVEFAVDNMVQAMSPSNSPMLNPLVWKEALDTGGSSVLRGARNLVRDAATPPRVPAMVDAQAFEVGTSLAATPGAVVLRTPVLEVIQYAPQAERVHATPLLLVPPTINKYYVTDLAPGRSLVEYLLRQGQQVFLVSWRNPDERHKDWGFDAYGSAILEAQQAVLDIAGAESAHLLAICSGGILGSMTAAHLAHIGDLGRIASLSLAVSVLDQTGAGTLPALANDAALRAATAASRARGYLDGRSLAEVFAWLRPGDLIWNYWVNNYLQGRTPPAFDILFWNADTTRMTAALHADFIGASANGALGRSGEVTLLDSPVDLSSVTVDSYIVAGYSDHLCPWQSCYASTQLLGGESRFVLSTSGHVAALVNPPTNKKAKFQVAVDTPPRAADWLAKAETVEGSWWTDYAAWLADRGGPLIDPPESLGSARYPASDPAPGSYVHDH